MLLRSCKIIVRSKSHVANVKNKRYAGNLRVYGQGFPLVNTGFALRTGCLRAKAVKVSPQHANGADLAGEFVRTNVSASGF